MNELPPHGPGSNTGHGRIWTRPDGVMAACGGPALCSRCRADRIMYAPIIAEERGRR